MWNPNQKPLVVRTLRDNPGSSMEDLAELTGLSRDACTKYIGAMRRATPKEAHISSWDRVVGKGRHTPRYTLGDGLDADYPKPLTQRMRSRRYKARNRARTMLRDRKERNSPLLGNPFAQLYTLAGVNINASCLAVAERNRNNGQGTKAKGTGPSGRRDCEDRTADDAGTGDASDQRRPGSKGTT